MKTSDYVKWGGILGIAYFVIIYLITYLFTDYQNYNPYENNIMDIFMIPFYPLGLVLGGGSAEGGGILLILMLAYPIYAVVLGLLIGLIVGLIVNKIKKR